MQTLDLQGQAARTRVLALSASSSEESGDVLPDDYGPTKDLPRLVYEAKLLRLMPGANALTRALTAAIVEHHGLLEASPMSTALSTAAVRHQAAAGRTRAAALCHEVQQLCAQAVVLQREAEQLCKPRLADA